MRQSIVVTLLVLIMMAAVGIIVARNLDEAMPPQARAALDGYLTSENAVAPQPAIVKQVAHALRPGRFDASFSSAAAGRRQRGWPRRSRPALPAEGPVVFLAE
jgi:hypothetical protein